jgi:integrase
MWRMNVELNSAINDYWNATVVDDEAQDASGLWVTQCWDGIREHKEDTLKKYLYEEKNFNSIDGKNKVLAGIPFLNIYFGAGFENASSHSGRRTFITEFASKGVSVRVLAELAGHSRIQTTQRYIDVNPQQMSAAV